MTRWKLIWAAIVNVFTLGLRTSERCEALAKLHQYGFEGSLDDAIDQALCLIDRQHQAIRDSNNAIQSAAEEIRASSAATRDRDENVTIQYFIPYDASYTKFHNGGPLQTLHGMTLVNVVGGIRDWDDIMGVSHFIKNNSLTPNGIPPNCIVRLNGLFEVSRWTSQAKPL